MKNIRSTEKKIVQYEQEKSARDPEMQKGFIKWGDVTEKIGNGWNRPRPVKPAANTMKYKTDVIVLLAKKRVKILTETCPYKKTNSIGRMF